MLPANEWWGILGAYGGAVWPAQAVFFLAGLVFTAFVFRSRKPIASVLMKLYLAFSFGWISLVFFFTLGKGLAGSVFFGALFMAVAILFAVDLFRRRMDFHLPEVTSQKRLTLGLTAAVFCYPLISIALGRPLQETIVPGTLPCPTTALALVLLTTSLPRVDKVLYIFLLFWAIPFAPFIQIPRYGVYEDIIMFGAGICALVMLVRQWNKKTVQEAKPSLPLPFIPSHQGRGEQESEGTWKSTATAGNVYPPLAGGKRRSKVFLSSLLTFFEPTRK